jgi:methionyl-tRNA formyltransferase
MDQDKKIIYFGTEGNAKSILGLKEVIDDGWNVVQVIAITKEQRSGLLLSVYRSIKMLLIKMIFSHQVFSLFRKSIFDNIDPYYNIFEICKENNIELILTPQKNLIALKERIKSKKPDLILSNGWTEKIPREIFEIPKIMAVNCHSSYLPEYRGGNVTFAPLINEEKQSGVTLHELVDKFDAGKILSQKRVRIEKNETPKSLNHKRALITGEVLINGLKNVGDPTKYKDNPPSPFYFRCSRKTYRKYKLINLIRKSLGITPLKYEPKNRYDI